MNIIFLDGPIAGLDIEVSAVPDHFRLYAGGRVCDGDAFPDRDTEICVYRRVEDSCAYMLSYEDFTQRDESFLKAMKISLDEPMATSQRQRPGCSTRDERGSV